MAGILILCIFFILLMSVGDSSDPIFGTEESLRQNLLRLASGSLRFYKSEMPIYNESTDITPQNNSFYDFIVIGAGSAGATIASRLSETNVSVLLIEAGSYEYPIMDIPAIAGLLQFSAEINWKYETESSDKYCLGFTDSRCLFPRGKVMGGSSILNYMVATRGNRRNYDEWAEITGDNSWSSSNMLLYFKKLENFQVEGLNIDNEYHNKNGPMYITSQRIHTDLGKAFIDAGKELGYPKVDYNGPQQTGFSHLQLVIKNGERWSSNRAYIHRAKNRENLSITRDSHVNRIIIDHKHGIYVARGVEFTKFNQIIHTFARKEVILSAGAINSPQILMLSGIGPAQHLKDLNISVIKDLAVGENLMDHIMYPGLIFKVNDSETYVPVNPLDPRDPSVGQFIKNRAGPLALPLGGIEGVSFLNVFNESFTRDQPNIELFIFKSEAIKDPLVLKSFSVRDGYSSKMLSHQFNHSAWTILTILQSS